MVKLFVMARRLFRMELATKRLYVRLLVPSKLYTVSPLHMVVMGVGPPEVEVAPWRRS